MTRLPLQDQHILITRPSEQAAVLRDALQQLGARVSCCPMLSIEILPPPPALDSLLTTQSLPDWLVFTSANGVRAFAQRAEALQIDLKQRFAACQIASVGPGTAVALTQIGLQVECYPEIHTATALAEQLGQRGVSHKQLCLILGEQARSLLVDDLQAYGAQVQTIIVYRSQASGQVAQLNDLLQTQSLDWLTFLNALSVKHFEAALNPHNRQQLDRFKIACIGPITAEQALQTLGRCDLVASPHTVAGLVQGLCQETA